MLWYDMLQKICIGRAKAYNSELPLRWANGTSLEQIVCSVCKAMCHIHTIHMIIYIYIYIHICMYTYTHTIHISYICLQADAFVAASAV